MKQGEFRNNRFIGPDRVSKMGTIEEQPDGSMSEKRPSPTEMNQDDSSSFQLQDEQSLYGEDEDKPQKQQHSV